MRRVDHREPGCVMWLLMLLVAGPLGALAFGLVASLISRSWENGAALTGYAVAVFTTGAGYIRLIRRKVPICPHCGVDTNPQFRVCRSCGRVKMQ